MTDPEKESGKQQGLSKEVWTAISAIVVALIGGIVTIFATIYKPSPSPSPSTSASIDSPTQPKVADIPLGKWSGMAKEPSGNSFPINVEINQACSLNKKCGYISVPEIPCNGEISFINVNNDYYEFDVSNFDAKSDLKICKPGAGELFRVLPDSRLVYKATYSNAEGVLESVGNSSR
jgi:hypothetical protein